MRHFYFKTLVWLFAIAAGTFVSLNSAAAAGDSELDREVKGALEKLYGKSASASAMGKKAQGILVFPGIVKGGFLVGGQYGEGALLEDGKIRGYYNTLQVSYGLQVGLQKYGYALFLMTDSARKWIDKTDGWEVGVGPSIVVMDKGKATSKTTTTMQSDIYAFFFDQTGLMGGLGLQGTKITRIKK